MENGELARYIARIVAVAPAFANAIVGVVDPKLTFGLPGKRAGCLDGCPLGGVDRRSALVFRSFHRPGAISPVRYVVMLFGHIEVPFLSIKGSSSKRNCLTLAPAFAAYHLSKLQNNPVKAPLKRRPFDQMVGKNGVFANSVFLEVDLYRIRKFVNSVNTAGRNRCKSVPERRIPLHSGTGSIHPHEMR